MSDVAEPPKQKWRFRVKRVADGSELIGPVLELPARPLALPAPVWAEDDNPNDALVPLSIEVAGQDGRTVRFIVEEEDGQGGWKVREVALAKLEGGKATVDVHLSHPDGDAEPDFTPDPEPDGSTEPADPKPSEGHAVRARAELL